MMSEFTVISNMQHITVVTHAPGTIRTSTASCDIVGGVWWINRVIVEPVSARGQGVGSKLLQRLIEEVRKYRGDLRVAPGGYTGGIDRQKNFYAKNGFRDMGDYMEYRGDPDCDGCFWGWGHRNCFECDSRTGYPNYKPK